MVALPDGSETFPKECSKYDVPCYGPILDEVMKIFAISEIRQKADEMKIKIPEYKVDTFIKGKMKKVQELANAASQRDDCTGKNAEAVEALKRFADAFANVNEKEMTSMDLWKAFIGKHVVVADWQDKLSFNDVLQNFGFDATFAQSLRQQSLEVTDTKTGATQTTTWEQEGVRWVSKALGGFKPVGCLVDAVNLVFALMGKTNVEEMRKAADAEKQIREVLSTFCGIMEKKHTQHIQWIPTHFMPDCESDDMLAWCLLEYIHKLKGSKLIVKAQLPAVEDADGAKEMERVESILKNRLKAEVFKDDASRNLDPIKQYWKSIDT